MAASQRPNGFWLRARFCSSCRNIFWRCSLVLIFRCRYPRTAQINSAFLINYLDVLGVYWKTFFRHDVFANIWDQLYRSLFVRLILSFGRSFTWSYLFCLVLSAFTSVSPAKLATLRLLTEEISKSKTISLLHSFFYLCLRADSRASNPQFCHWIWNWLSSIV